jgi:hypothetical protein
MLVVKDGLCDTNESVEFAEASESANRSARVLISSGRLIMSNLLLLLCRGHWQTIELYNDQPCCQC